MAIKLIVLFFTPLLSGLLIFLLPKGRHTNYRMLLVFAGSYLFAITVIHILPELYSQSLGLELIGLFVLIGFFLQQLLEYFTSGVEHGHIHAEQDILSSTGLVYLYALVCGNFLHISTTIVFESTPGHKFDARKMAVAVFGSAVAVGVEYII